MNQIILDAINAACGAFVTNELAFLCLTSKIERPFVDRLAFQLFIQFEKNQSFQVTREWSFGRNKRADIAILCADPRLPARAVIEVKAMGSFDPIRRGEVARQFPNALQRDLNRFQNFNNQTQIYSLLLAVHPLVEIHQDLRPVVSYISGVRTAFQRHRNEQEIYDACCNALNVMITPAIGNGRVAAGTAFGVGVEMLWWLYGPFAGPENLQLVAHEQPQV